MTYKIVRHYFNGGSQGTGSSKRTIMTGLTLEQAREHCKNSETSSSTATSAKARRLTRQRGAWFDGYAQE